jgi:hypothetical protein
MIFGLVHHLGADLSEVSVGWSFFVTGISFAESEPTSIFSKWIFAHEDRFYPYF